MQIIARMVVALTISLFCGCASKPDVDFDPWTPPELTTDEERTIRALARAEGLGEILQIEVEKSRARSGFEIRAWEREQRHGGEITQRVLYVGSAKGTNGNVRRPFGHRHKGGFWTESIHTRRAVSIEVSGLERRVGLDEGVASDEARRVLGAYFDQMGAMQDCAQLVAPEHNAVDVYFIRRGFFDSSYGLFLRRKDGREDGQGIVVRSKGDQLEVTGLFVQMS